MEALEVALDPFRTVSEGKFSETHIQLCESLSNRIGARPMLASEPVLLNMPLVTRLDRYAGTTGKGSARYLFEVFALV
jgi:hypothetical protein